MNSEEELALFVQEEALWGRLGSVIIAILMSTSLRTLITTLPQNAVIALLALLAVTARNVFLALVAIFGEWMEAVKNAQET